METAIQKIPFLRIAIALASGIVLASALKPEVPDFLWLGLLFLLGLVLLSANRFYKFRHALIFGLSLQVLFIVLGILVYSHFNKKQGLIFKNEFLATVLEVPQEKTNSFKSTIRIFAFRSGDSVFAAHEKVIAYFEKTDAISDLQPGTVIRGNQVPQVFKNSGNPYDFDIKKYWERKRIYRQVYLAENNWVKTSLQNSSVLIVAENLREKLLSIYRSQPIGETEFEILSALTLGNKRDLDPETRRVFSSAGAMHVLAVSGLHVGIIFWLVSLILGILKRSKTGRLLFFIASAIILWGYALITGLSPSVMRASAMFTIYIAGETLQRRSNVYNSLSASAFLLLLINPNNLFDLGFLLSYSAVFGIVYLQPRIQNILIIKNKILLFFWSLLTVSLAAQIATFPITIFFFNQFPTYFWLSNTFIIPAVMILIPAGIALLFLSALQFIATPLALLVHYLVKTMYLFLSFIDNLPGSVANLSITNLQLLLIVLALLLFFSFLESRKAGHLKLALTVLLVFVLTSGFYGLRQNQNTGIFVYNNPANTVLHLVKGKTNFVISEKKIENNDFILNSIRQTCLKTNLHEPAYFCFNDTVLRNDMLLKKGAVYFGNKLISFENIGFFSNRKLTPDYAINPPFSELTNLVAHKKTEVIINKGFNAANTDNLEGIHFTGLHGAFMEKW